MWLICDRCGIPGPVCLFSKSNLGYECCGVHAGQTATRNVRTSLPEVAPPRNRRGPHRRRPLGPLSRTG